MSGPLISDHIRVKEEMTSKQSLVHITCSSAVQLLTSDYAMKRNAMYKPISSFPVGGVCGWLWWLKAIQSGGWCSLHTSNQNGGCSKAAHGAVTALILTEGSFTTVRARKNLEPPSHIHAPPFILLLVKQEVRQSVYSRNVFIYVKFILRGHVIG